MAELGPDVVARHDVNESLLAEARAAGGIGPELEARIGRAMLGAASSGAKVVVCTCSTIGGVAERVGQGRDLVTQRIDRAMADAAVSIGHRLMIVATLPSTLKPTREIVSDSAARLGREISTSELVVEDAWRYFEQSMLEAYIERIATAIKANAQGSDVVVLAQASMAGAAELCPDLGLPILSSPRLGVWAAVTALGK